MSSKKLSQEELRKLMKEKRENSKSQKIDSPFAKYNNSGQLTCTICNIAVKGLWIPHIAGKIHKENLHKTKKGVAETSSKNATSFGIKRKSEQPIVEKKAKTDDFKVPAVPPASKLSASSILASYSSSDEDSGEEDEVSSESTTSSLPPNFFDNSKTNGSFSKSTSVPQKEEKTESTSNKTETIPEGFFDDPILDAMARKVKYVDPQEEEWERFKKSIAEETNVSKTIIEEDLQESTIEREINIIDEELYDWQRKKDLDLLAESVKTKAAVQDNKSESDSDDEDLDEDDLLDWRTKSIKKK